MSQMLIDGVPTEIGDAPITVLAHKGDVRIAPVDQVEIGTAQTLARAAAVTPEEWAGLRADPGFAHLFNIVFPAMSPLPEHLRREGTGVRHFVGLLLLMLEALSATPPRTPFLVYPESFLHPSAQSKLAEVIALMSGRGQA